MPPLRMVGAHGGEWGVWKVGWGSADGSITLRRNELSIDNYPESIKPATDGNACYRIARPAPAPVDALRVGHHQAHLLGKLGEAAAGVARGGDEDLMGGRERAGEGGRVECLSSRW
jgi:hypothetical protein